MKKILFLIVTMLITRSSEVLAQCAMCKTTIVNNVSNGELALAEGLNFGIMYLFVTPYLAIMIVGAIWFYKYKKHGKNKFKSSAA
ncbi:hypothetical protein N6H18_02750 [Reichenbachiella agarivorans]|uniref:Uncharacterized protein n=1 Tax=Reichenbachiella agarivorans TaxID=2979464 RepID=A0ABY6CS87_9BACT|nr:hypothetical protein [Reichenbachiella agarivorans]UXP32875.1 hypothetical protein N6H18_02750 [Reichenbachiella agarivorans]